MADHHEDDEERNPFAAPESDLMPDESEDESSDRSRRHRVIEAGDVISTSWEIFKRDMGLVIAGWLVFNVLNFASSLPQSVFDIVGGVFDGQGDKDTGAVFHILGVCLMPLGLAGQVFFQAGLIRFLLNVVRGEPMNIGDLFTGGRFFWRLLGSTIIYGLIVVVGTMACIVPGIILALMFAPFGYLLVDEDLPGIDCIGKSREVTKDNLGALFLLAIAAFGINVLGILALCIGTIFTGPLTTLFFAVAYCKMTGQRTAEDR